MKKTKAELEFEVRELTEKLNASTQAQAALRSALAEATGKTARDARVQEANEAAARALAGRDQVIAENQALMRENELLRKAPPPNLEMRRELEECKLARDGWKLKAQIAAARARLDRLATKARG